MFDLKYYNEYNVLASINAQDVSSFHTQSTQLLRMLCSEHLNIIPRVFVPLHQWSGKAAILECFDILEVQNYLADQRTRGLIECRAVLLLSIYSKLFLKSSQIRAL